MTKSDIKKAIKDQFVWDGRVLSSDIHVEISDSTAILSGEVPTYSSRVAAEEDALSVSGINHVENKLKVKYPENYSIPSDKEINSAITNMLSLDHRIDSSKITVTVDNGVVVFRGDVDAYWKKDVIVEYAYRVTGIVGVVDEMTVTPHGNFTDETIAEDIKNALRRNGFVSDEEIKVKVKKGEVTLSGTVPSYSAKMRVKELAYYTTGVINVIDNIKTRENLSVY